MSDKGEKECETAAADIDELNVSNFEDAFSSTIISVHADCSELDETLVDNENDTNSRTVNLINKENQNIVSAELTLIAEENNAVANREAIDEEGINLLVKAVEESADHFDCDSDNNEHEGKGENEAIIIKIENNYKVVSISNDEKVENVNNELAIVENRKRLHSEEKDLGESDDNDGDLKKRSSQQSNEFSINQLTSMLNESIRSEANYSRDLFHNDADMSLVKSSAAEVECGYNPDYFNYINRLWCVDSVPDPHKNATKRFAQNTVSAVRNAQVPGNKGSHQISVHVNKYLCQRIDRVEDKIICLDNDLQTMIKNCSTQAQQNTVLNEIEELKQDVEHMKRDKAEVKHKFEFYKIGRAHV